MAEYFRDRPVRYIDTFQKSHYSVLWDRRLVDGLSSQRFEFDSGAVNASFMVDTSALEQVFVLVRKLSPVSIVPPLLHSDLHLNTSPTGTTNGETWEPANERVMY